MSLYTVRTEHGELKFESLLDLEKAWLNGLVEAEDEVVERGQSTGIKAGQMKLLKLASVEKHKTRTGHHNFFLLLSVGLAVLALFFLSLGKPILAALCAVAVAALLFQVTTRAFSRKR
jgi:Flp pilus assembly protein TadB